MPGVTHIQIQAALHYDDGFVVTFSSPLWKKDIRQGDYFPESQIAEILVGAGQHMAEIVETKTVLGLHNDIRRRKANEARPKDWHRRPRWDEPFSKN